MDINSDTQLLTTEEFIGILRKIFNIDKEVVISEDTDLAEYIRDSIDLGELLAVLKQEKNIQPQRTDLFSKYSRLEDVLKIINNRIAV